MGSAKKETSMSLSIGVFFSFTVSRPVSSLSSVSSALVTSSDESFVGPRRRVFPFWRPELDLHATLLHSSTSSGDLNVSQKSSQTDFDAALEARERRRMDESNFIIDLIRQRFFLLFFQVMNPNQYFN